MAGAKDAENAMLRKELAAERELRRRLELRIAVTPFQVSQAELRTSRS